MFVMMNSARLGVGMQGLGLAEVALQNAVAYARDRVQGRSATGVKQPDKPADSIMVHPDVRRMLLTCKAYTEGGRAITTWTALLTDREKDHPDPEVRAEAGELRGVPDAGRQGLHHRQRVRDDQPGAAGLRRPRLHPRMGHGAVRARCAHQHDLRGHQRHPGARPARPQGAARRGREASPVRQAGQRLRRRSSRTIRKCGSSRSPWRNSARRSAN